MKLQAAAGSLVICVAAACRPIGPPDSHTRPIGRPTTPPAPVLPSVGQTASPAATPAAPGVPPPAVSTQAPPPPKTAAAARPNSPPPSLPQASKPATPKDPYLTAQKVPNKPGYALSPHTGKLVLIDGIPSGVVVPDQTCPPGEKKFFRVP